MQHTDKRCLWNLTFKDWTFGRNVFEVELQILAALALEVCRAVPYRNYGASVIIHIQVKNFLTVVPRFKNMRPGRVPYTSLVVDVGGSVASFDRILESVCV